MLIDGAGAETADEVRGAGGKNVGNGLIVGVRRRRDWKAIDGEALCGMTGLSRTAAGIWEGSFWTMGERDGCRGVVNKTGDSTDEAGDGG